MIVSGSGFRGLQRRLTPQEYHCGGKATYETAGGECKGVLSRSPPHTVLTEHERNHESFPNSAIVSRCSDRHCYIYGT